MHVLVLVHGGGGSRRKSEERGDEFFFETEKFQSSASSSLSLVARAECEHAFSRSLSLSLSLFLLRDVRALQAEQGSMAWSFRSFSERKERKKEKNEQCTFVRRSLLSVALLLFSSSSSPLFFSLPSEPASPRYTSNSVRFFNSKIAHTNFTALPPPPST